LKVMFGDRFGISWGDWRVARLRGEGGGRLKRKIRGHGTKKIEIAFANESAVFFLTLCRSDAIIYLVPENAYPC